MKNPRNSLRFHDEFQKPSRSLEWSLILWRTSTNFQIVSTSPNDYWWGLILNSKSSRDLKNGLGFKEAPQLTLTNSTDPIWTQNKWKNPRAPCGSMLNPKCSRAHRNGLRFIKNSLSFYVRSRKPLRSQKWTRISRRTSRNLSRPHIILKTSDQTQEFLEVHCWIPKALESPEIGSDLRISLNQPQLTSHNLKTNENPSASLDSIPQMIFDFMKNFHKLSKGLHISQGLFLRSNDESQKLSRYQLSTQF